MERKCLPFNYIWSLRAIESSEQADSRPTSDMSIWDIWNTPRQSVPGHFISSAICHKLWVGYQKLEWQARHLRHSSGDNLSMDIIVSQLYAKSPSTAVTTECISTTCNTVNWRWGSELRDPAIPAPNISIFAFLDICYSYGSVHNTNDTVLFVEFTYMTRLHWYRPI